jgi:cation transport ATPase
MIIWDTILTKLIGTLPAEVVSYYKEKKKLEQEVDLERLRGKAEYERAKTQRASESEGRDHDWEIESIKNSGWKDEWVLILLSIPLVLVFIPYTQEGVLEGFQTLEQTPQWYQWLILVIFTAIYGIRIYRRRPNSIPETRYITVEEKKDE